MKTVENLTSEGRFFFAALLSVILGGGALLLWVDYDMAPAEPMILRIVALVYGLICGVGFLFWYVDVSDQEQGLFKTDRNSEATRMLDVWSAPRSRSPQIWEYGRVELQGFTFLGRILIFGSCLLTLRLSWLVTKYLGVDASWLYTAVGGFVAGLVVAIFCVFVWILERLGIRIVRRR